MLFEKDLQLLENNLNIVFPRSELLGMNLSTDPWPAAALFRHVTQKFVYAGLSPSGWVSLDQGHIPSTGICHQDNHLGFLRVYETKEGLIVKTSFDPSPYLPDLKPVYQNWENFNKWYLMRVVL